MLKPAVEQGLNKQINLELESAYVYLAMAAHLENLSLPGCAGWMQGQAREEVAHAMRLFEFVNDRGGKVVLEALPKPTTDFGSPRDTFAKALEHEQKVSASINDLYALAQKEGDYATQQHLLWFIEEQVEEEKTATDNLDMFERAGDHGHAILMIDKNICRGEHDH